jgi:hypothetical protein
MSETLNSSESLCDGGRPVLQSSLQPEYKTGALLNRVTARDICGIRPQDIEWIWIVEEKRNATPEEIRKLCKRAAKK